MSKYWYIIECRGEHGITMMDEDTSYDTYDRAWWALRLKLLRDFENRNEALYCIVSCDWDKPQGKCTPDVIVLDT